MPNLNGKWSGTAFLYANAKGFSASDRSINLNTMKQSGLDFSGDIETKDKDKIQVRQFSGVLDKQKRYFCIVTQDGDANIGYIITKSMMKVYMRTCGNNSDIAAYRLIKEKISP